MKGKKSLEYRLQYALNLAKRDPNARILFAFRTFPRCREAWHIMVNLAGKPHGFSYKVMQHIVQHENGGSIRFVSVEDPACIAGALVTHAWVEEDLETYQRNAVEWRIRSPHVHNEPPAIYDEYFVTRKMDY